MPMMMVRWQLRISGAAGGIARVNDHMLNSLSTSFRRGPLLAS
ncbi:MAG: hypothetical protein V3T49_00985 [Dehalococcoidia bacterium]